MLGTLIKTSLVDYPGRVAATYFVSGCNIRCPYCYNAELVINTFPKEEAHTLEDLYNHLEKRKNVLSGFVLSGGEPLLYPETKEIIQKVKSLGYKVKLDTNGLFPERLEELLKTKDASPDYVAMDIKTSPSKYHLLHYSGDAKKKLTETISLLQSFPSDKREFRTVLCPPLVKHLDIEQMAAILPDDANWFFAQFRNDHCLDQSYNSILPYTESEIQSIIDYAQSFIQRATIR